MHGSAWKDPAIVMALFVRTKVSPVVILAIKIKVNQMYLRQYSRQFFKLEKRSPVVTLANANLDREKTSRNTGKCKLRSEGFQKRS